MEWEMKQLSATIVALAACFTSAAGHAKPVDVSFASLAQGVTVMTRWFLADGTAKAKRPVIIALHGSGGAVGDFGNWSAKWTDLAKLYNAAGYHLLVPDSFTPRGIKEIVSIPHKQRRIHEEDRRLDVYGAVQLLNTREESDSTKIAVVGFSHGAQTVLSTIDNTEEIVNKQPIKLAAAVAYYPSCSKFQRMLRYEVSVPVLMMVGASDTWTPPQPCADLAQSIEKKQSAAFVRFIEYSDSYHGFDGLSPVRERTGIASQQSGKAMTGGNPAAREASRKQMMDYLAARFAVATE
jgi:dienelactone hydrolase